MVKDVAESLVGPYRLRNPSKDVEGRRAEHFRSGVKMPLATRQTVMKRRPLSGVGRGRGRGRGYLKRALERVRQAQVRSRMRTLSDWKQGESMPPGVRFAPPIGGKKRTGSTIYVPLRRHSGNFACTSRKQLGAVLRPNHGESLRIHPQIHFGRVFADNSTGSKNHFSSRKGAKPLGCSP